MEGLEISHIARSCQTAMSDLLTAMASGSSLGIGHLPPRREVEQMQERYEQWVGNLGASQPSKSRLSLDHRLRDSATIREFIMSTLNDLHISLQTDIATGRRPNRVTSGFTLDENIDMSEFNISSSDSDISSIASSGNNRDAESQTSEFEELLSAAKNGLDSLFRASMFIRKFASNDRRQRASTTKPFDNGADIMYIKDRYPLLVKRDLALANRLGEANARRRQYFKYRRDHHDRLSTVRDQQDDSFLDRFIHKRDGAANNRHLEQTKSVATGQTKPSRFADTEATALVTGDIPEARLSELLDVSAAMSVVSFATSIAEVSENELPFPPLPAEAKGNSSFLCPYCLTAVETKQRNAEHQWRKHVLQDLEPYICTFSTCGLESYHSQHTWFEHEMLVHRRQWTCPQCSNFFTSPADLESHMRRIHSELIPNNQVAAIIEQSKRPIESIQPTECPFCDGSWAEGDPGDVGDVDEVLVVGLDDFRRHVGHHLQQLALFTLPRLNQDLAAGSNDVGGFPDRDDTTQGYRWVRDDCGRGWAAVSRKRAVFVALASFLDLYRKCDLPVDLVTLDIVLSEHSLNSDLDLRRSMDSQGFFALSALARLMGIASRRSLRDVLAVRPDIERHIDENNVEKFRLRKDWERWILPIEDRDLSARNSGPLPSAQPPETTVDTGYKIEYTDKTSENICKGEDHEGNDGQEVGEEKDGDDDDEEEDDGSDDGYDDNDNEDDSAEHRNADEDKESSPEDSPSEGSTRHKALADLDPDDLPESQKREGPDWFAVFNPEVERVLDVELVHSLAHETYVWSTDFSSDGRYLATGCNNFANVFDVLTGKLDVSLRDGDAEAGEDGYNYVRGVRFTPDGKYLVACQGDGIIRLWDIQQGTIERKLLGHEDEINSIALSSDGRYLYSGSDDETVRCWDMTDGTLMHTIQTPASPFSVALSPDGHYLAAGLLDNTVCIWETSDKRLVTILENHTDIVYSVFFTPDGGSIVTSSFDKTLKLWELDLSSSSAPKRASCLKTFEGHKDWVIGTSLTPDGQWIISGSKDNGIHFWDPITGAVHLRLKGHRDSVISVAASPTNNLFATGSGDRTARIWRYMPYKSD